MCEYCDHADRMQDAREQMALERTRALSLIGRDRVVVEKAAKRVWAAVHKEFDANSLRQTDRGNSFDIRVPTDGDDFHVRVTIELPAAHPRALQQGKAVTNQDPLS